MFEESIKSEKTLETYTWYVQYFVDYWKLKSFDSILKIPKDELQKMIVTYVIHTKKRVSPNSVPNSIKPIKLFLEVNDVELGNCCGVKGIELLLLWSLMSVSRFNQNRLSSPLRLTSLVSGFILPISSILF